MHFAKRVVVAVNLNEKLSENLKALNELSFLSECEVQFIYVFPETNYSYGFGEVTIIYPPESDKEKIRQSTEALLREEARKVFPSTFKGKLTEKCLFGEDPKDVFCQYVRDHKIDLVIMVARKKHGLFDSSFSNYVSKHTTANLIVLKNSKEK